MDEEALIKLDHVSFHYRQERVLEDIDLEVKRGDFMGIIGPNGSGKTTLLKIMLGLLQPTSGSVSLFGMPQNQFHQWGKIGYVPQRPGLSAVQFPITVGEVVGMASGKSIGSVMQSLAAVGMENQSKKLLSELSGGQQQRVFIARSLVTQPELLILDEPTVGVDVESQAKFYQLLNTFNKEHRITLILVSHDIDVVAHEVSVIACINRTLVFDGKPKDLLATGLWKKLYGDDLRFVMHGH